MGLGVKQKNDTEIDRTKLSKELYKRIIKKFKRHYVYSPGIDIIWTSDLLLIPKYANYNNGYKYILTVMDVFSKYALVRVMKNKDK